MNDVQEKIKDFIAIKFAYESETLNPEDDLLSQGIVDSMGILQLVTHMEETFGIQISDDEIVPENFRTLQALADLVSQKLAVLSSGARA